MESERYLCPRCKEHFNTKNSFFPFCSERCKMLDLGAWASEKYRIKGKEVEDKAGEIPEDFAKDD